MARIIFEDLKNRIMMNAFIIRQIKMNNVVLISILELENKFDSQKSDWSSMCDNRKLKSKQGYQQFLP